MKNYREYKVRRSDKEPLLDFIVEALESSGCRIVRKSEPDTAPFWITFDTPEDERLGIVVYAFFANSKLTKNRPADEHRFQVKYGTDDKKEHTLWRDEHLLYTTLFCGIDPERKIFVGADPVLHQKTRFFISIEYKQADVDQILKTGWHAWERDHRAGDDKPIEVLVGGTATSFLDYVKFEREALGEEQGPRMLIADRLSRGSPSRTVLENSRLVVPTPGKDRLHSLVREFEMNESEVLDLIASARRLKMAVRGWVAESHLVRQLQKVPGVSDCVRLEEDGGPDVRLRFQGRLIDLECKNVLRKTTAEGLIRVDFQRTRASKSDPCSRYYKPSDFDVVAACVHAVTERWEFQFVDPQSLDAHSKCPGRLSNNVKLDERWSRDAASILSAVAS